MFNVRSKFKIYVLLAATLLASLNKSVDPCEDFYEFSCGGWIKNHPVPPTESHWNQFNVVDKKLNLQLKGKEMQCQVNVYNYVTAFHNYCSFKFIQFSFSLKCIED